MFFFSVPWAALESCNARLRPGRKRLVNTTAYKRALEAIHLFALRASRGHDPDGEGRWRVQIDYFPPDRRRRDVHNYDKAILDALEGAVYDDDWQVKNVETFEREPGGEARAEIQCVRLD